MVPETRSPGHQNNPRREGCAVRCGARESVGGVHKPVIVVHLALGSDRRHPVAVLVTTVVAVVAFVAVAASLLLLRR